MIIRQVRTSLFLLLLCCGALTLKAQTTAQKLDFLIKNATVFLGDGLDSIQVNVGIVADRIAYLGKASPTAKTIIDGSGKYLAPGFIDTHTHADRWVEDRKRQELLPWLYQGVTTVFAGNDGFGTYKIADKIAEFNAIGMGTNFALYAGFGPIRKAVLDNNNVQPNTAQLEQMKAHLVSAMQEGAIGFSTGLIYLPQMYSKTPELIALYKTAAQYGAVYDTHMRNEGDRVLESIDETIKIGAGTNLPIHISHLKIAGEQNWGMADELIKKVNKARKAGMDLTACQYPFIASMTSLKATLIPSWAQEGGNTKTLARFKAEDSRLRILNALQAKSDEVYKRIVIMSKNKKLLAISGKNLYDIARQWAMSNEEAVLEILSKDIAVSCMNFSMNEEDLVKLMKQKWVMTGSDGGGMHPRTYATFTRIMEEYVLKRKIMSMSWAIHRATGLTAQTFGIKERGLIKEGYFADIILFDPLKLKANASYTNPEQLSDGMDYVFVNGKMAIKQGNKTGELAGKVITKN